MPVIERVERIGGATVLGIPAFDFFVWALDTYGRGASLMNLRDRLPAILFSPGIIFLCMCAGLGLLYTAHNRQVEALQKRGIVFDSSGAEYRRIRRPRWLIPVGVVFALALVVAPLLAVKNTLAYKGTPPKPPSTPRPPYFAYDQATAEQIRRQEKTLPRASLRIEQHGDSTGALGGSVTQGPCSNLQIGGSGNRASTNCVMIRSLTDPEKAALIDSLSMGPKTSITVWSVEDGLPLADDLYNCLKVAGWNMREPEVTMALLAHPEPVDVGIFISGNPEDHSNTSNPPLAHLLRSLAPLKDRLKIDWARSDKIDGDVIKLFVFPPSS